MSDGSQAESECAKFVGRDRDLCEGQGSDGRPHPRRRAANIFRARNQLAELPPKSTSQRSGSTTANRQDTVDKPPRPARRPVPRYGRELKQIFASLGVKLPNCFTCGEVGARMNQIGAEGVRRERDELIEGIKERAKSVTYAQWLTAAANAVATGLVFSVNPFDPIPGLFDEALRRADAAVVDAETSGTVEGKSE